MSKVNLMYRLIILEIDPCGRNSPLVIQNQVYGHIQSPNYPDNYENGLDCSWWIKVKRENSMLIKLIDVQLEGRLVILVFSPFNSAPVQNYAITYSKKIILSMMLLLIR